jgi:hypothetical protein
MRLLKCTSIAIVAPTLLAVVMAVAASKVPNRTEQVTVPDSTLIHVALNTAVASDRSQPGDHFEATISEPIVIDGTTVIPKGAHATGVILDARPSGRLKGRAHLQLALETLSVNGSSYEIRTASELKIAGGHKNRNLALIGGGAGGGLLIGAIAGGGEGALIGGPIGVGAGAAAALLTGKKDVRLPAETPITFRLAHPVTIDVKS